MLPLFIGSGLYFCCCTCLCCTLWLAPKPSAKQVPSAPVDSDLPTPADTGRSAKKTEGEPLLSGGRGGGYGLGGNRSPPEEV